MNIAMLGAGNVGRALTESLVTAGHTVTVSSRTAEKAEALASETGARAVGSNREAVEGADVVILAVPTPALDEVVAELADALEGKIVVDPTNRFDPDAPGDVLGGTSNAEKVQQRVPGARVVKAFNVILGARMSDPEVDGVPADSLVAADDEEAKHRILELSEQLGFRPVDAGALPMARALEAMGTLMIGMNMWNGWSWETAWKVISPSRSPGAAEA